MALNYVTLTGTLPNAAGALAVFTPSNWLTDPTDQQLEPPAPVPVTLTAATVNGIACGVFSKSLLATDNANLPAGWNWTVTISGIPGVAAYSFSFKLYAGPITFTATNASPCVFTATAPTGQPWSAGQAVTLSGSPPSGFSAGTTYYVVNPSGSTFSLATTPGGTALNSTSTGSGTLLITSVDISTEAPVQSVAAMAAYLPLSGGTMTGALTLAADPTAPLQPATKQYVDGGFLGRKAATSVSGFALQNGTPTIISWAVPNDGKQHAVSIFASVDVTSAQTGGGVICSATAPDASSSNFTILNSNLGPGFRVNSNTVANFIVGAGTTVSLQQTSAQTGGAATVWAEIWGA